MDLEDPELPGEDFLIVFNKDLIGKWTWRILTSREQIPYCFKKGIVRKMDLEDPELPGEDFLIVSNKDS